MNERPFSAIIAVSQRVHAFIATPRTRKRARLIRGHGPQVLEIALVADEHDDDVRVRVVAQLLQPALRVLVRAALRDVVHEERADRAAVVPKGVVG